MSENEPKPRIPPIEVLPAEPQVGRPYPQEAARPTEMNNLLRYIKYYRERLEEYDPIKPKQ